MHKVLVLTGPVHPADPIPVKQKLIDWDDSSDRKWLVNHMHHCMHNAKSVLIRPDSV
jgi:hypothetical protein